MFNIFNLFKDKTYPVPKCFGWMNSPETRATNGCNDCPYDSSCSEYTLKQFEKLENKETKYFYVAEVRRTRTSTPYKCSGFYTRPLHNNTPQEIVEVLRSDLNAENVIVTTFNKVED